MLSLPPPHDGTASDSESHSSYPSQGSARSLTNRGEEGSDRGGGAIGGVSRVRDKQEQKMRKADDKARREWKKLSAAMDVLLEAGIGACSLPDAQGCTPPMLAGAKHICCV